MSSHATTWSLEEGSEPPDTSDTGPVGNHIINLQSCANYHPHGLLTADDITRSSSGLNEDQVLTMQAAWTASDRFPASGSHQNT